MVAFNPVRLQRIAIGLVGSSALVLAIAKYRQGDQLLSRFQLPPFMVPTPEGLVSVEHQYTNSSGTRVLLIPMIHIANRSFYDSIFKDLCECDAIILEECVVPEEMFAQHDMEERRWKRRDLLTTPWGDIHPEHQEYFRQIKNMAVTNGMKGLNPALRKHLSPAVTSQQYFIALYHEYLRWVHADDILPANKLMNAFRSRFIFSRLNRNREDKLIASLRRSLTLTSPASAIIAIPWGAAHCARIEQRLIEEEGFIKDERHKQRKRLALHRGDYEKLIQHSTPF